MKIKKIEEPILRTLLYSDIFDYPLTEGEVWKYLISDKNIEYADFSKAIKRINSVVYRSGNYLHMEKRRSIFDKRHKRNSESELKLIFARKIIKKLSEIPSVMFVGISGSLSMLNSEKDHDIDLFVITKHKTIWTTRLLLISYLKILGLHRGKDDKKISNKFCLNMIIDDKNLRLPKEYRNIYTAHEITQLMPIVSRNKTYDKFLKSNKWVLKFLPNAFHKIRGVKEIKSASLFWFAIPKIAERIAGKIQTFLINKNKTNERIEEGFLAFHPRATDKKIMSKYRQKLIKYNLS
ncbi:MAG: hypothetical protein UU21_C0007G0035 [Candidatus Levybacteria bacterium GW2011_GWA2_40_8]|nr:MAG: hypothetical protein UU21_C0007G0035 [Candidatus Levybacteria bacterium GW2011_GWA2_40_8]